MQQSKDYIPLKLIASNVSRSFNFKKYNEVIFVNTGDVLEGKFLHKNITSRDGLPGQAKKAIQKNDILLTEIRPANKRFAFVHNDKNNYVVSTKFMVIVANQIVNPMYLYTVLTSNNVLRDFQSIAETRSGTFPQITFDAIADYEIYVPSKNDQSKIVSIIEVITKKIDLLKETNKTLESIAQAIFKSWFIDFDPVHAKQEGKECAGIDKATADLFPNSFVESELGSIPKGWEVYSMGDKIIPKRGKIITKLTTTAGDIPVVAGGLDPAYFHNQSNVVSPAITISSSGANAGFVRLYQQDIWASDCCYISSEQIQEVFFWYIFLKANQEKIYFMQQGAAQPHIYASDLMRLTVCLPKDFRLVAAFNTLVTPLFNSIKIANNQIHTLSNLRDTLLPRLISGKLDLSNIEEQIEGVT